MPCKNKVRVNAYFDKQEYLFISNWAKNNSVSVSSIIVMLCNNFLEQERNGENTYTLSRSKIKPKIQTSKTELAYEDYINDHARPDYNWLDAALYNLEHSNMGDI